VKLRLVAVCLFVLLVVSVLVLVPPQQAAAASWTYSGLGGGAINSLAWDGSNLYAGCDNGRVYRDDGGGNWTDTGVTGWSPVYSLAWTGTYLYAASGNNVYRYDGVGAWTNVGTTGGAMVISMIWNGTNLYAGCSDSHAYVYVSGTTWTDMGDTGASTVFAIGWKGTDIYAGGNNTHPRVYVSGTTWTDAGDLGVNIMSMLGNGADLYAGCTDGTVYVYAGGGTWNPMGNTTGGRVHSLAWDSAHNLLYAGCDNGHVYFYDGVTPWADTGSAGGGLVYSLAWNGTNLCAGCYNGHVYAYIGGIWTDTWPTGGRYVLSLARAGTDLYAGCRDGHVYLYGGGTTWTDAGTTGAPPSPVYCMIWNGTNLYAGCQDAHVYVFAGGTTWTDTGVAGLGGIFCLAWDYTNLKLYAGSKKNVYVYNGGWTYAGNPTYPTDGGVFGLAWNGADLYAGCTNGQVYKFGGGTAWNPCGDTTGVSVNALAWNGADLYAGCQNGRIYRYGGGVTWNDTWPTGASPVKSLVQNGSGLCAGCENGHVYAYGGGTSWNDTGNATGWAVLGLAQVGTVHYACGGGGVYGIQGISTVTASVPSGHGAAGPTPQTINWGDAATINIAPDPGYHIASITDNTIPVTIANPYVIMGVVSSHDVAVTFTLNTYTISASAYPSAGGTVSGAGPYTHGDTAHMGALPSTGYHFVNWTEVGTPVSSDPNYSFTVTANHTLVGNFALDTYTVTTTVPGGHGNAGPTPQTINWGDAATINIAPDPGYNIASITDNTIPVTITNPYVINNVTADHNVVVTFARGANPLGPPYPPPDPPNPPVNPDPNIPDAATQPSSVIYLAEGSTAWGFDCYISIENPNNEEVTAEITYMTNSGPRTRPDMKLPALSRTTLNPRNDLGNEDFSTRVKCKEEKLIAADRTMSWTGKDVSGAPYKSPEGSCSSGVSCPAKEWYLPEGCSAFRFETWLLIQNPNSSEAYVDVTYMIEGEGPVTVRKNVPANSRATFNMEKDIGQKNASIKVKSEVPVIPERAQYRNNRREGADSIGTTVPLNDFFLAEGSTAWGFTEWVLVQNPNNEAVEVTLTYMTPEGPKPQAPFTMPANSRKTIKVNDQVSNSDLSTKVHGSKPIIAERAMYWNTGPDGLEACHDQIGSGSAHSTFYLADGQTSDTRETWTLVQNPNSSAVEIGIYYLPENGTPFKAFKDTVPANSRKTYNMADAGIAGRASILVETLDTSKPIMVERAMYWNSRGAGMDSGGFWRD
jgi:Divergent InlB B-repeat domain